MMMLGMTSYAICIILMLMQMIFADNDIQDGSISDYCHTETFLGECPEGTVIVIQYAKYGRMRIGRCVKHDLGYMGCHTDALLLADEKCSGKRTCQIRVPDTDFEKINPCLEELRTFLEISYKCIPVDFSRALCRPEEWLNVTSLHGFLSSKSVDSTHCGNIMSPWVIMAQPGQTINLTLYDFHISSSSKMPHYNDGTQAEICQEYGMLEDVTADQTTIICGRLRRISHVYKSKGHILKIWITNPVIGQSAARYLLEYEVLGCPDPVLPDNTLFRRNPDGGASVSCRHIDLAWTLDCEGYTWMGPVGNCSIPLAQEDDRIETEDFSISYGVAIAIILGAAFGIGLIILVVGLLRYRRRSPPHECRREVILLRDNQPDVQNAAQAQQLLPVEDGKPIQEPCCATHGHRGGRLHANNYEHIWETPLPSPSGSATLPRDIRPCPIHHKESVYTAYRDKPIREPLYVTSKDIYQGDVMTLRYETARYSALDKRRLWKEAEDV